MLQSIDIYPMWWSPLLRKKVNRTEYQNTMPIYYNQTVFSHKGESHDWNLKTSTEFKVLPKRGIRIQWDDTVNFTQSKGLLKTKKHVILSFSYTNGMVWQKTIGNILCCLLDLRVVLSKEWPYAIIPWLPRYIDKTSYLFSVFNDYWINSLTFLRFPEFPWLPC